MLPLVGIVHVIALTFTGVASMTGNVDAASVVAFVTAATMTLAIYVGLPVLVIVKLERAISARRQLNR